MATDIILSQPAGINGQDIDAICLGSGRFLRSVLVPFLSSNSKPAVFQTRGRTFLDSFKNELSNDDDGDDNVAVPASLCYPVDTIEFDGTTTTSNIDIYAAGTLGTRDGKSQLMDNLISNIKYVSVIGVGVTEAGLQSYDNQCMLDLTQLLYKIFLRRDSSLKCSSNPNGRICVINTDNVPNNGDVIRNHMLKNCANLYGDEKEGKDFLDFLETRVAFLNSMVDRITSSRTNSNGLVPSCEPLPTKALVICDPNKDLPLWMDNEDMKTRFGVKIRHTQKDLESDISLKLRVANGTHTAVAHAMALLGLVNTEALCDGSKSSTVLLGYLDSLFDTQILPGAVNDGMSEDETKATWEDWRKRLQHPHFGLSTFFITQNGAAKCGIRLGPTIKSLVLSSARSEVGTHDCPLSVAMAFAVAAIVRFFTPVPSDKSPGWRELIDGAKQRGVYVGWLDDLKQNDAKSDQPINDPSVDAVTYADGLQYNLSQGWYEFRCNCLLTQKTATTSGSNENDGKFVKSEIPLPEVLSKSKDYKDMIRSYLLHPQGGDLKSLLDGDDEQDCLKLETEFDTFVGAVSALYARMIGGDSIILLLQEIMDKQHVYTNGFATSCTCLQHGE